VAGIVREMTMKRSIRLLMLLLVLFSLLASMGCEGTTYVGVGVSSPWGGYPYGGGYGYGYGGVYSGGVVVGRPWP